MRITKITPWLIEGPQPYVAASGEGPGKTREYIFVEVSTDDGVTGWGEVTNSTREHNRSICALIRRSAHLVIGEDVSHIEAIWNKVFRTFSYMGSRGAVTNVISGVDIALWDIRGKATGVPVYQLLGGPVRNSISLYTHPDGGPTIDGVVRSVRAIAATGHTALKTDPFPQSLEEKATPYGFVSGGITAEAEQQGIEQISAIREAVGPRMEVLIDAHGRFNVPTAIRLANRLAQFNIGWFEEPVPVESYDALQHVKEQVPVPICVGERLFTRFDFVPVLKNRLAQYIMPDVTWTGGITELKKIATLAESFYVPVSPHDASGPINILAGAHTMMTVPNFYRLETMRADLHAYDAFIDHPLDIRQGELYLSSRSGLGVDLNRDFLREHSLPVE